MAKSYQLSLNGADHVVEVEVAEGATTLLVDGERIAADLHHVDGPIYSLLLDGASYEVAAHEQPGAYRVTVYNHTYRVEAKRPRATSRGVGVDSSRPTQVKSPLTGMVVDVAVAPGEKVIAEQVLVVVESMKMNNELRSPRDGTVATLHVTVGQRVERNALLVTIE